MAQQPASTFPYPVFVTAAVLVFVSKAFVTLADLGAIIGVTLALIFVVLDLIRPLTSSGRRLPVPRAAWGATAPAVTIRARSSTRLVGRPAWHPRCSFGAA